MLTATTPSNDIVSQVTSATQNETNLSDTEILRRVREIRSTWSVTERLQRRREADQRFSNLLEALLVDQHAA